MFSQTKFHLDPRTKLIILIISTIISFCSVSLITELITFFVAITLLMLFDEKNVALKFALIFIIMIFGEFIIIPLSQQYIKILVGLFCIMFRRFIPCIIFGYILISTTTVSEFIAAMESLNVSKAIIIPLTVLFRFFPTVKDELSAILDGMKIRGIQISTANIIKSPIANLEYILVPLLRSSLKIGDELSASALSRGFDIKIKRTNICQIGFKKNDYITFIVILIVFLICIFERII